MYNAWEHLLRSRLSKLGSLKYLKPRSVNGSISGVRNHNVSTKIVFTAPPRPKLPVAPLLQLRGRMMSAGPGDGSPLSISTIYALSTSPGRAAIAVVRISGPLCKDVRRRHYSPEQFVTFPADRNRYTVSCARTLRFPVLAMPLRAPCMTQLLAPLRPQFSTIRF